jgi:hypothetical protein
LDSGTQTATSCCFLAVYGRLILYHTMATESKPNTEHGQTPENDDEEEECQRN